MTPYEPALCQNADGLPTGNLDNWWMEPKLDGCRMYAMADGSRVSFMSPRRSGGSHDVLPTVARALTGARATIDGEVVWFDPTTHEIDFNRGSGLVRANAHHSIQRQQHEGWLTFVAFDLLELDGHDLRNMLIEDRYQILAQLVDGLKCPQFTLIEREEASPFVQRQFVNQYREGVVLKRRRSIYPSGRTSAWLKLKVVQDEDVVIMGAEKGAGKFANTLGALVFGQYRDGELTRRGTCSGMTDKQRDQLWHNIDQYIGQVCVIRHMGVLPNQQGFRHPQFDRMRDDKLATDCTWTHSPFPDPKGTNIVPTKTKGPKESKLQEQRAVDAATEYAESEVKAVDAAATVDDAMARVDAEVATTSKPARRGKKPAKTESNDPLCDIGADLAKQIEAEGMDATAPPAVGHWYVASDGTDGVVHFIVRQSPPLYGRAACGLVMKPGAQDDETGELRHDDCNAAIDAALKDLPLDDKSPDDVHQAIIDAVCQMLGDADKNGKWKEISPGVHVPNENHANGKTTRVGRPKPTAHTDEPIRDEELTKPAASKPGKASRQRDEKPAPAPKADKPVKREDGVSSRGAEFTITKADVEKAMHKVDAQPVTNWAVTVNGVDYPRKQVAEVVWSANQPPRSQWTPLLVAAGFTVRQPK